MINGSEQLSNETEYMQNQLKISIGILFYSVQWPIVYIDSMTSLSLTKRATTAKIRVITAK